MIFPILVCVYLISSIMLNFRYANVGDQHTLWVAEICLIICVQLNISTNGSTRLGRGSKIIVNGYGWELRKGNWSKCVMVEAGRKEVGMDGVEYDVLHKNGYGSFGSEKNR